MGTDAEQPPPVAWPPTGFVDEGGVALTDDGGLYKKVLVRGDASAGTPPRGATCKVHYTGTLLDGSKFDSSRDRQGFFEFAVGLERVIQGWDVGVMSMNMGEKCVLACRADYAYGETGLPPKVPESAALLFEVELFSWKETRTDRFDLDGAGRLQAAERCKEKGTEFFKLGQVEPAVERYADALYYLEEEEEDAFEPPAGREAEATALHISCLLNAATCTLKLGEYEATQAHCTRALRKDPNSVKARFRRGTARMRLGDLTAAKEDLLLACKLDPKSREVREGYDEVIKRLNERKKSERGLYSNMMKDHKSTFGPKPEPQRRTQLVKGPDGKMYEGEVMADFAI